MGQVSVLVVDDQPMIRSSVRSLLEHEDDIVVVGEAGHGEEAVALASAWLPSTVLLDLRMPRKDGLWVIDAMRADPLLADVGILVLTTFENDQNVVTALRKGANGFVGKSAPQAVLVEAVRTVSGGGSWLSTSAATSVVRYLNALTTPPNADSEPFPDLTDLTVREREILVMVGHDLPNEIIADRLSISKYTVKTHVNRAMTKLGVATRAGLVAVAYRSGLMNRVDRDLP